MILNKQRMLEKMEQFNLDALIAPFPENVKYLSDFQSQNTYMYRIFARGELCSSPAQY